MSRIVGQAPESQKLSLAALFAALILLAPGVVPAQPLSVGEAERLAVEAEPGREALRARADALDEQAVVAAALPDPVLNTGLNNFPIESGGFATEGMTNAAIGLRQSFPPAGTRASRARIYEQGATGLRESGDARTREVRLATRNAWLRLYHTEQARSLVVESRPFFEELATITRSLYAVGRRSQQDVLHAELELSRLDDRLIDIEQQIAAGRATLGEWIGAAANRPLAASLPAWRDVPPLEALEAGLDAHPLLRAADAEVAAKSAGVELAEGRSKPGWAVQVGYSYRDGRLPDGTSRSDFVSVGVSIDLPWFNSRAVDSTLAAALGERSAAESGRERLRRQLLAQLRAEYARWQERSRRLALYDQRILGQARLGAEAALAAYQSDDADFAAVMRASIDDLNTRIDYVRLQTERAQSFAALAALGGFEQ